MTISIGAIVLAAGDSSRLGQPKQLLEIYGQQLLHSAIKAAQGGGCSPVLVVLGGNFETILPALEAATVEVVQNNQWQSGLGTSIRCGLEQLMKSAPEVAAVILLTCDQPFVDASVIAALCSRYQSSGKPIVASRYAGTLGVPALFDRSCFEALLALPDDSGAKLLIQSRAGDVAEVEFEAGAVDIDTPADIARAEARQRS